MLEIIKSQRKIHTVIQKEVKENAEEINKY